MTGVIVSQIRMLMYKVFGKDGWEDVIIKDFGQQKKAFLSGQDSILATPYLPNLVRHPGCAMTEF